MVGSVEVFISYTARDVDLRDELEAHLSLLKRDGLIQSWHAGRLGAGEERRGQIDARLHAAQVVVLLVSADYLAGDAWEREMVPAVARARARAALVIPVLARPCDWESAPFAGLMPLPSNRNAVTSWPHRDAAWTDVAKGLREAVGKLSGPEPLARPPIPEPPRPPLPREGSSHVRRGIGVASLLILVATGAWAIKNWLTTTSTGAATAAVTPSTATSVETSTRLPAPRAKRSTPSAPPPGRAPSAATSHPAPLPASSVPPLGLWAGGGETYGRQRDGSVLAWGGYAPLTLAGVAAVAPHGCARMDDGTAKCWGTNKYGTVGDGTTASRKEPTLVLGRADVVSIAIGLMHACAAKRDGSVVCWGANFIGQLGAPSSDKCGESALPCSLRPVPVPGVTDVVEVVVAGARTCARQSTGTVLCWGKIDILSAMSDSDPGAPPTVVPGLTDVIGITGNRDADGTVCVWNKKGTVQCWGLNAWGEVGTGATGARPKPTLVARLTGAVQVTVGSHHTCARNADGAAYCWGYNEYGQLGDGTTEDRNVPTLVRGMTDAVEIAAGDEHTCARKTDGAVYCWGANGHYGTLGVPSSEVGNCKSRTAPDRMWPCSTVPILARAAKK